MKLIHFEVQKNNNGVPTISVAEVSEFIKRVNELLHPYNMECIISPFKITWNNEIGEIDNIDELNISDEIKSKFLEIVEAKFQGSNAKYTILETL